MKKIILALAMSLSTGIYAQIVMPPLPGDCNNGCISGSINFIVGQSVTFTSNPTAQCTSCYDWDINGSVESSDNSIVGTLQIVDSDVGKTVVLKAVSVGNFSVNLTYFDETGCHTCCFNGIISNPPPNCCVPVLTGHYTCRQSNGNGSVTISGNTACEVDWNSISKIEVDINPGYFVPSNATTQTLYPPFDGYPITMKTMSSDGHCYDDVSAVATYYYSNGCGVKTSNIIVYNNTQGNGPHLGGTNAMHRAESTKIVVSPNPTSSVLKFEGKELGKYKISITNDKGLQIIDNGNIDREINIENQEKGIYYYHITGENGFSQKGKIIKE